MRSRALGSMPSPAMNPESRASPTPQMASQMSCCNASSEGTGPPLGGLHGADAVGITRFAHQYGERGEARVPFDQGGFRPEAVERMGIEVPYGFRHRGAVIVDQDATAVDVGAMVAGEMNLANRAGRQHRQIGPGIKSEIVGIHVEVVDIAENAAAGAADELRQELGLRNCRMAEAQIGRGVLDQKPTPEGSLRLIDVGADDLQALLGIGKREKIVEVDARQPAPREMLGNQIGIDPIDQRAEAREVPAIERARGAKR